MMGFRHPYALLIYLAFAALCGLYAWSKWKRRRAFQSMGDWRLLAALFPIEALRRRRNKDRLALAALGVLVFAAAGPQFGTRLKEVKQRGVDVFICIDTSRSMLAEDVAPYRLERARRSLGLLVDKLAGNRLGVVAFAKRAVLQCPLTIDTDAARLFLETVNENTVPEQGTGLGTAIRLAMKRFPKEGSSGKAIVLLTDGEDHNSDPLGAAKEAKERGIVIFTVGIGTPKGEVIKNRDSAGNVTEFHKYKGEMVVTHLDDATLTKIAELTGGAYYRTSSTDQEIDEIAEAINGFEKRELTAKVVDRLQERYQPFALLALLLLLLEFFFGENPGQIGRLRAAMPRRRPRGAAAAVAALFFLSVAAPAAADVRESVRQGNKLFKKGDIEGAIREFESARIDDPDNAMIAYNIGTAQVAGGKLEEAVKSFERAETLTRDPVLRGRIAYNAAHALYQMGKDKEALEKFKQTARLNPRDTDAKYNIEYIKSGKKPPPRPDQKPSPKDGDEKKDPQQQQQQKGPAEAKDQQDEPQEQQGEPERKPGELSKEDAERILQMTKDQEAQRMKERPARPLGDKNDKAASGEDW